MVATFRDLDVDTLYALLKLRADVFVVEQECAYADLDGRDTEPGTRHVWLTDNRADDGKGGGVRAYLRILDDGDAQRIGRVVVDRSARGAGLAGRLLTHALTVIGDGPSVLHAQAHLVGYYQRFGYRACGPQYLEDGIPHVPMRREPAATGSGSVTAGRRSTP